MARHCPAMDDCHCVLIAMGAIDIHVTQWALPDEHKLTQDTELGTYISAITSNLGCRNMSQFKINTGNTRALLLVQTFSMINMHKIYKK